MSPTRPPSSEEETRTAIVDEALSWLRTPWHHEARVKAAGVDCAQFLIAVYSKVGLIDAFDVGHYPQDWHLHRDEDRFMNELLHHCRSVDEGKPGDVVMFRFGRHPAHGAILMNPDIIIHAWRDEGRVTVSEVSGSPLEERFAGFYRWKGFA